MHPELGPIAVLSSLSLLLPLPWHWRARNIATLAIIGWLFTSNLIYAVDAFIWIDNVDIVAPVWCDITTKLIVGANFALPAACLCICIHLERVASIRSTQVTYEAKRRRQWFEAAMCFGLPIIFMVLHYIVQGHRYDIIEGYGCRPATYYSVPAILIVWIPPILLSTVAIVYAGLALRHFIRRRLSFAAHLYSSNSALTPSRYLRLMTMSALQMVWSITVTCYAFYFTGATLELRPWTTWDDVHSDWLRVDVYPDAFSPPFVRKAFYGMWWFIPISTFFFVAFFSFGQDAMDEYKKCYAWLRAKICPADSYISSKKWCPLSLPMFKKNSPCDMPISKPALLSARTSSIVDLPPYDSSTLCTTSISPSLQDFKENDCRSQAIPTLRYGAPKAIGSYADISTPTPSTPSTLHSFTSSNVSDSNLEKPLPTPPALTPPLNSRLRPLIPKCPPLSRPLTYPSFEAAQLSVSMPHA